MNSPNTALAEVVASGLGGGEIATLTKLRAHVDLIQDVMTSLMKANVHYGVIPGTPKPTLYLPGAELLMVTFRLAPEPEVEVIGSRERPAYRVKLHLHAANGRIVGTGIGSCSIDEEKYAWRAPVCEAEFVETPSDLKREKWAKGRPEPYKKKQIRTNGADLDNTILKMAKKRALIDGVRMATGCSDIFEQDIEDLPEEVLQRDQDRGSPAAKAVQRADAEVDPEKRKRAVAVLEEQLKSGVPLDSCWKLMTRDFRLAVGTAEWERLKKAYEKTAGATGATAADTKAPKAGAAGATAAEAGGHDTWIDDYGNGAPEPGGQS